MAHRRSSTRSPSDTPLSTKPPRTNPSQLLDLTNRPPPSGIDRWVWQQRMFIESTFALTMLEPWEKILVCAAFTLVMTLFVFGIYYYLPHHLQFIYGRAKYYLYGDERAPLVLLWNQASHAEL